MGSASDMPPFPHQRAPRRAACLAVCLACVACRSYNDKTAGALEDFRRGRFDVARDAYATGKLTDSGFLAGAEAGMVALTAGDWEGALEHLGRAAGEVAEIEDRAIASPEQAGEILVSWVVNEGVKAYYGEGYERVQLHAALAIAYFGTGASESAMVEARRANLLLESEEKLYDKDYRAGGLGHLISAIAYEILQEPNDAYIDYARMESKGLAPELVGPALVRLARSLGFSEEAERWQARYGDGEPLAPDAARIIVIAGIGLGPYKRDTTLTIPTPDGLIQWSVPEYVRRPQPVPHVALEVRDAGSPVRTVIVEDVAEIARRNLADRIAWLGAKSAVRAWLKYAVTDQLGDRYGTWARVAGALFTFATERADLRAWHTLPDTWQAARLFVDPGVHRLWIHAPGAGSVDVGDRALEPGETMFVFVRTVEHHLYVHPVGGVAIAPVTGPANPSQSETGASR